MEGSSVAPVQPPPTSGIAPTVKRNVQEVEVANSSIENPLDIVNNVPLLRLLSITNPSSLTNNTLSIASKIDEGCRRILVQGELAQNSFIMQSQQQQQQQTPLHPPPPPHANPRLTGSIFAPPSKETTSNKHSYSGIPLLPTSLPSLIKSHLEMQREHTLATLAASSPEARSLRLYKIQQEMREKVFNTIHLSSTQPCSPEQCNDIALRLESSLSELGSREQQKRGRRSVLQHTANTYQATFVKGPYSGSGSNATAASITSQALRQARLEEKRKADERRERQRRERQAWQRELSKVTTKLRELQQGPWRTPAQKKQRLTRSVLQCHANWERESSRKLDKMAKDRIRALKEDDEEGYLALLDKEKDGRLTYLLRQTDEFLEGLSIKLSIQQRLSGNAGDAGFGGFGGVDNNNNNNDDDAVCGGGSLSQLEDVDSKSNDNVVNEPPQQQQQQKEGLQGAHRIKEEVKEQPKLMTGGTLKEYQLKGLQWMVSLHNNNLNGILADEMGLGKTVQTIALISHLLESKGLKGPYLVLVPLSTMTNWVNELKRWAPSLVTLEWRGSPTQRKALVPLLKLGAFNVLLTTYEYIIRDKKYLSKISWLYLVVDEGHRMKNASSKLSLIISSHYRSRYRLLLTGTPLQNNLPELWALLNFLLPTIFNSVKSFEEWFNAPFAKYTDSSSVGVGVSNPNPNILQINEEEALLIIKRLHKLLRPFLLRRLKKDVEKELPDKREEVVQCPMSELQRHLYEMIKREGRKEIMTTGNSSTTSMDSFYNGNGNSGGANESKKIGITKLNNTIMQLRKVCNHPFIFEEVEKSLETNINTSALIRSCGKFDLLNRMLPKLILTNHRVLIFFQMTQIMTIVEDFLIGLGIRYLRLDGSTKADERTELLNAFNSLTSPFSVFLLSTRAGGLGLNLQVADTVIIFDSDWNPHQDLQAQDRAHRIGQTKEVRIYRLVTKDSIEEYIVKRAQEKLNLDGKVIQAGRFDHKSTSEERDEMLKALMAQDSISGNTTISASSSPSPSATTHDEDDGISDSEDESTTTTTSTTKLTTASKLNQMMQEEEEEDEFLNEILARTEDEMATFREYDLQKRQERWSLGTTGTTQTPPLPRLFSVDEVPLVYKETPNDCSSSERNSNPNIFMPEERAARLTKKTYDENGDDGIEKDWLMSEDELEDHPPHPTIDSTTTTNSANTLNTNKKLKLTLKLQQHQQPPPRKELTKDALLEGLKKLKKGKTVALFLQKPCPTTYADYYEIVKSPISLHEIASTAYPSNTALMADLNRMFDNAYLYNSPTSQVCKNVEVMKKWVQDTFNLPPEL